MVLAVEAKAALGPDGLGLRAGPPVQEVEVVAGLVDQQAAADFSEIYLSADKSKSDNISTNYVGGFNYNFNQWSRIQAFYTIRQEEGPSVNNNYLSVQYQIGF